MGRRSTAQPEHPATEVIVAKMYQAAYRNHSTATNHLTTVNRSSPRNSPLLGKAQRLLPPTTCREQSLEREKSPGRKTPIMSAGQRHNQAATLNFLAKQQKETINLVKSVAQLSLCDNNYPTVLQRIPYPDTIQAQRIQYPDTIQAPANGQVRICKTNSSVLPNQTSVCCQTKCDSVDAIEQGPISISCGELGEKLQTNTDRLPIILDCRSFLAYNICHINAALNIGCLDRLTKRRLQQGKMQFCDLIKCHLAKEKFNLNQGPEIVVYDDQTQVYEEQTGNVTPLVAVIQLLLKAGKRPMFLKGGLNEFHAKYKNLCVIAKPPPDAPLYSPTTHIVSDEIDKAVASKILPFLFLGNERDIANLERLKELDITHILNCTANIQTHFEDQITYLRLPASDSGHQNLKQYFQQACDFIENVRQSGGRVMIHCQAGVSRSSTIVIAYLMCYSQLTMHQAYQFVKSKRSIIAPNFNFMGQLMELEQFLLEGKVERHVCPELLEELKAEPSLIQEK